MANPVTHRFIECHDTLRANNMVKSSRQFAKSIGTLPQSLNEILKGKRDATVNNLMQLVAVYQVNSCFLLSGEGEMFKQAEIEVAEVKEDRIMYVPTPAYAGYMDQFHETLTIDDVEKFSIPGYQDAFGEHRCFDVQGRSMEPTLYTGDRIICSKVPTSNYYSCIKNNHIHVVVTATDILVKRLVNNITKDGTVKIISDNESYPSERIAADDIKEVWRVNLRLSQILNDPCATQSLKDYVEKLEHTIKVQASSLEQLQLSIDTLLKK